MDLGRATGPPAQEARLASIVAPEVLAPEGLDSLEMESSASPYGSEPASTLAPSSIGTRGSGIVAWYFSLTASM